MWKMGTKGGEGVISVLCTVMMYMVWISGCKCIRDFNFEFFFRPYTDVNCHFFSKFNPSTNVW